MRAAGHRARHGVVRAAAARVVTETSFVARDRRLESGLVIAFAVITGLVMLRHEMWRDELQAWLVAKASPSPGSLLHNTRFEGHPILWYALLWPFAHLSHSPRLEQLIEWVVALGATALVVLRAPLTRLQKALLIFLAQRFAPGESPGQ